MLLSVDEALNLVLPYAVPMMPQLVPREQSVGCVLAEPVDSDVDSPPHDKSIVDGYAVRSTDLHDGTGELTIIEEVVAGQMPQLTVMPGQTTRIMTGAALPDGADCVVMFEHTTPVPAEPPAHASSATAIGQRVRMSTDRNTPGQNIMRRAASMQRGQVVLPAGHLVRPIEIGVLAEVGRTEVSVVGSPQLAILATGNELVASSQLPAPGQIRNSNGPMLAALAQQTRAEVRDLGIGIDDETALTALVRRGLTADVLLISGGVSAGVLDLVPHVLSQCGVRQVFHKVSVKPGKPMWFGVAERPGRDEGSPTRTTLVFGLPGNPVSTLVSFNLFVRPAIERLRGLPPHAMRRVTAALATEFSHRGYRPTYQPARWQGDKIAPLTWRGSGDLRALADAAALIHFPPGDVDYPAGTPCEVCLLD